MSKPLLSIKNLNLKINGRQILSSINLEVNEGTTVALVGMSGSGKSMLAHTIMQLLPPSAHSMVTGSIFLNERNLLALSQREIRAIRGNSISMAFQEALHALNPLMKVGSQIREALPKGKRGKEEVYQLMDYVGISEATLRYNQYPHEFSGGMRQRVMLAIALAGAPDLLIADEPTTALDVTIQAQIIELLKKIQQEKKMSILLITHDLGVVASFADQTYVMNEGRIVENGSTNHIFYESRDSFTKQLIGIPKRPT